MSQLQDHPAERKHPFLLSLLFYWVFNGVDEAHLLRGGDLLDSVYPSARSVLHEHPHRLPDTMFNQTTPAARGPARLTPQTRTDVLSLFC